MWGTDNSNYSHQFFFMPLTCKLLLKYKLEDTESKEKEIKLWGFSATLNFYIYIKKQN